MVQGSIKQIIMKKFRLPRKWKKAKVSNKGVRKRSLRNKAYSAIVKESVARTNEMFKVSTSDISPDTLQRIFGGQIMGSVWSISGEGVEMKYVTWDEGRDEGSKVTILKTPPCAGHAADQERSERLNIDDILDVL